MTIISTFTETFSAYTKTNSAYDIQKLKNTMGNLKYTESYSALTDLALLLK